ncbi:MAG TPA: hypothetical protein VG324_06775, partial [Blastocatellia bacterium]|nr:hypothetical protein [Blastocatellia bacterium]
WSQHSCELGRASCSYPAPLRAGGIASHSESKVVDYVILGDLQGNYRVHLTAGGRLGPLASRPPPQVTRGVGLDILSI